MNDIITLRGGNVSLILDLTGPTPVVVHWGADLGGSELPAVPCNPVPHSAMDDAFRQELVPQASRGWRGTPALEGHRSGGRAYSPALITSGLRHTADDGCDLMLADVQSGLELLIELRLSEHGMLRMRSTVQNVGDTEYSLLALRSILPVGPTAGEILDLSGRWSREQHPQRHPLSQGTWLREYRHGRTGHDAGVMTAVGSSGFSNRSGQVWASHLGFSGNHSTFVESTPLGSTLLSNAELLNAGEMVLEAGEEYSTPWTFAVYSAHGIDGVTDVFHRWMRARPSHPREPRPVVLNTWEAVYFDHQLEGLIELAEHAQRVGVERFVLDDGWFRHRRNAHAGLGDWYVDEHVWPDGLGTLIGEVRRRGMQFGLWVEPEMVNEDSDVIRAHPDWISGPGPGRTPLEWRFQQCLDLVNPEAWNYAFERLDALLTENEISYLKWDQNRDLVEMGHQGSPSTHDQTVAAYRLMHAVKIAHPHVEIESCSSGGARVDIGVLEHTDRVWASDCNDALERTTIQRWTSSVLPPELIGTHVGPTTAHTTGRTHSLSFRAIAAIFGHFGIEWDIRGSTTADQAELGQAVALYKDHRALIHSGTAVHADLVDRSQSLSGTVSEDRGEALFAFASLASSPREIPGYVTFPGLDPDREYRVEVVFPTESSPYASRQNTSWIPGGITASGRFLEAVGLPMPILNPEHAVLIHLRGEKRPD